MQIIDIKEEIQRKVKERVDKHQREYILREQLKLIREELGEESTASDAEEFEKELLNLPISFFSFSFTSSGRCKYRSYGAGTERYVCQLRGKKRKDV